jgi:hypothetical protein
LLVKNLPLEDIILLQENLVFNNSTNNSNNVLTQTTPTTATTSPPNETKLTVDSGENGDFLTSAQKQAIHLKEKRRTVKELMSKFETK